MRYKVEILLVLIIIAIAVLLALGVIAFPRGHDHEGSPWSGTDDQAASLIAQTGYQPWSGSFSPVATSEFETLFFSLQAAAGALVIGYILGYYQAKKETRRPP